MIRISHDGRYLPPMELKDGETVGQLIIRFKEENKVHFNGDYNFRETNTGRSMAESEVVPDNRLYWLTAWIIPT